MISLLFESMLYVCTLGDVIFLCMAYAQKSKSQQLTWDIRWLGPRGSNPRAGYVYIWDVFSTEYLECAQGSQFLVDNALLHILTQNLDFTSCDMQINTPKNQREHAGCNRGRGDAHIIVLLSN